MFPRSRFRLTALAVLAAVLLAPITQALAAPVHGQVQRNGEPAVVGITFINQYTGRRYSVQPDEAGRYRLELPTGAYTIELARGRPEPARMLVLERPVRRDITME